MTGDPVAPDRAREWPAWRAGDPFDGAHAVITGGSSGIGLATAARLAARGARLSLVARGPERLASVAHDLAAAGADVEVRAADVADQAALTAALGQLEAARGPCDILVSSAGVARPGHFLELGDDVFREMMEVDYFGTLYACRAVAPSMAARGGGSMVALSSAAGLIGIYGYTAYGPAKFAVRGLMESLRAEMVPAGVHVACVCPPDVDTPQLADENRYKPDETRAVAGAVRPLSALQVADAIVAGIERRRFLICPGLSTRALGRFASVLSPALQAGFDRKVAKVRARQRRS